jgi:hypothetical protein
LVSLLASTVIGVSLADDPLENGPFVVTFLVGIDSAWDTGVRVCLIQRQLPLRAYACASRSIRSSLV